MEIQFSFLRAGFSVIVVCEGSFMTIKKRLILSYLAMLLVPFILIMITGGVVRYFTLNSNSMDSGPFPNSRFSHYSMAENNILSYFNTVILDSPEKLFSNDYMNNLEIELNLPGAFAVIQQDNIMYKSSRISEQVLIKAIKNLNEIDTGLRKHMEPEIMFRWEFKIPNQHNGVLYYLIDPDQLFSEYFLRGLFFIFAIITILILTNGTLTYMVSRSIVLPLKELEKAALKIKDGELDSKITYTANDEMGDVFSSFNEMRERLKDSLEKQISYEENRKELIASISHDIRTPLTVLKGYVEGLKDGVANTEEKKDHYLNTIYQKAHQMDHLIDNLFLFSKMEMDKYPYNPVSVELSQWMANAVADLSVDYPEINFQTFLKEKASISADPAELFRVISNIVQNSYIYAGRKDIVISVIVKITDNQSQIIISDNGIGVSEKKLPLIFDRFYQADESRSQNPKGSGIGLSIAKMIINQHRGQLQAVSQEGKGLSIIITIPLTDNQNDRNNSEDLSE